MPASAPQRSRQRPVPGVPHFFGAAETRAGRAFQASTGRFLLALRPKKSAWLMTAETMAGW